MIERKEKERTESHLGRAGGGGACKWIKRDWKGVKSDWLLESAWSIHLPTILTGPSRLREPPLSSSQDWQQFIA